MLLFPNQNDRNSNTLYTTDSPSSLSLLFSSNSLRHRPHRYRHRDLKIGLFFVRAFLTQFQSRVIGDCKAMRDAIFNETDPIHTPCVNPVSEPAVLTHPNFVQTIPTSQQQQDKTAESRRTTQRREGSAPSVNNEVEKQEQKICQGLAFGSSRRTTYVCMDGVLVYLYCRGDTNAHKVNARDRCVLLHYAGVWSRMPHNGSKQSRLERPSG